MSCTYLNNARTHSVVQATVPNPSWGGADSDRVAYDGAGRMVRRVGRACVHAESWECILSLGIGSGA
jgi:hypothetical protein